jgi:spore germination protein KC
MLHGETPTKTSDKAESFGTAVFRDDSLVGELTGMETICHLMVMNKFESCTISAPDLYNSNHSNFDLRLFKKKSPKIKVDIINGIPYIYVEIFLQGYGLSLDSETDYSSEEGLNNINTSAETFLENKIKDYLNKTSKEFNSDIDGFGKKAISKYLTIGDWNNSNWLDNYKNSVFDVKVHVNIKSGYEFNKAP